MAAHSRYPHIILDAHQDIAMNYVEDGRDFRQSALKKRNQEDNSPEAIKARGLCTTGLPDALLGRVGIIFGTLYVNPPHSQFPSKNVTYQTPREAHDIAMRQVDYYKRLADEDERLVLIQTKTDLDTVLRSWVDGTEVDQHKLGLVILMEGADPIIEPSEVYEWYEHGVRIIGPAWSETRYSGGTGRPGPLTSLGFELLEQMADLRMILDLSHIAEEAYYQALDRYEGPIFASHSNPRHFRDSDRMLSNDMIIRLAERDGVMGVVPFNRFMSNEWKYPDPKENITIEHVVDIVDYICQLTGSAHHVGIGSDWDGGFGSESIPYPFDTVTDLWLMDAALQKRGFNADDIHAILCGNFLRILEQGLPG